MTSALVKESTVGHTLIFCSVPDSLSSVSDTKIPSFS